MAVQVSEVARPGECEILSESVKRALYSPREARASDDQKPNRILGVCCSNNNSDRTELIL